MRRFSQRNPLVTLSDINITPLLDLAFVLLIIFIILTPSIRSAEEHGMNLNLPQGGGPTQRVNVKNIRTVEIAPDGTYMLDRLVLPLPQIESRIVAEHKRNPEIVVRIRGDKNGRIEHFVAVLNICKMNGIPIDVATQAPAQR